jgi:Fe-S cluster biogenesis protein NfuA
MAITTSSFVNLILSCSILTSTQAFTISTPSTSASASASISSPLATSSYHYSHSSNKNTILHETTEDAVVSPFEEGATNEDGKELLELTWDNVDMVLDDMRPYLIQDGGNVKIAEIDGPVVRLQLEGACGTCPSSTQTMKMGLERGLRERIPEIQEVIQAMPEGPALTADEVEIILDGVRPFLSVAGGTIDCESIMGEGSVQPVINLKMGGGSASLNSVKLEISQRLQRHFMLSGLKVEWM